MLRAAGDTQGIADRLVGVARHHVQEGGARGVVDEGDVIPVVPHGIADREAASAYVAVNAQKPAAALRVDLLKVLLSDGAQPSEGSRMAMTAF